MDELREWLTEKWGIELESPEDIELNYSCLDDILDGLSDQVQELVDYEFHKVKIARSRDKRLVIVSIAIKHKFNDDVLITERKRVQQKSSR